MLYGPPRSHHLGTRSARSVFPAARRAEALELEIRLPLVRVLPRPAAVLAPARTYDADGLGEAAVARRVDGLEIVDGAKDVVVPSWREGEPHEYGLDGLPGPVGAKEPVHQEELTAAALRGPHLQHFGSTAKFVEPQAFEHAELEGGPHRADRGALVLPCLRAASMRQ